MGSHGLKSRKPTRFYKWAENSGFTDEFNFWSSLSGQSTGTMVDHMDSYLGSLGYTGTVHDKFISFLRDQTGLDATIQDMAYYFFDHIFSAGAGNTVVDDDGNVVKDDNGNVVTD